ncbi:MAG: Maf family protein, partial [Ginsengibacter sp.]
MKTGKIILASKSPRRSQLLQWAEIEFEIVVADTDESYPHHLSAHGVAIHIATNKAMDVKKKLQLSKTNENVYPILAADTIVVLNNEIIGKPGSREDAITTLTRLSGQMHKVITGTCILSGEKKIVFAEETQVEFIFLSEAQIAYYVDNYKPYDKAGAYAIQEWIGVTGIEKINGDYYNVMGLPIGEVIGCLNRDFG